MATNAITAPKGIYDVDEAGAGRRRLRLERAFFDLAGQYGYPPLAFPFLEYTELFERGVGSATDIVSKEMYTFVDRGGRSLTLRPEGTAGCVRAFVEHHHEQSGLPWKAAYSGPMFRAENVQRGRYRQFFQYGIEAIGIDDPALDVEVIEFGYRFLTDLAGLGDVVIKLNTIGDTGERRAYVDELRRHIVQAVPDLGDDDRRRLDLNPLRLLDSKTPEVVGALDDGPRLQDSLADETRARFGEVCAGLDSAGIAYTLDERLVRGLDYYTATTFEYAAASLDVAQDAVGGGGHYDGLVAMVGGPDLPGIGLALGVERILLAAEAEAEGVRDEDRSGTDFVIVRAGETGDECARVLRGLRASGLRADMTYGDRSLKAQFKQADRLGAHTVVIVGERDVADGNVTVRDMISGDETTVGLTDVVGVLGSVRPR